MTLKEEFAALTGRIAKARADLHAWQAAGRQEKYLEAYSKVEALELELERLRQTGLYTTRVTNTAKTANP